MRIARLHVSDVTTPPTHPLPNTVIPIYAYLVETPSGVLLFDTGVGPVHDVIDALYRPRRRDLRELVTDVGVALDDVEVIVNCHLHFDHCGGNQFFPRARILVQGVELEASRAAGYTVWEWVEFQGARVVRVDGEHVVWNGVWIVPTPGHTAGHQSLVLDVPGGRVVLAGQAAESAAGFEQGVGGWSPDLTPAGAASLRDLKALSPTRVLFAHDDAEWCPSEDPGVA